MSRKESWKAFGKNTGNAFKNFGKAMTTTMKVAFTDEKNDVEENGQSKLRNAWSKTGKGFGEAGKSLGGAAKTTVTGDKKDSEEKEQEVIDVDSEMKKEG